MIFILKGRGLATASIHSQRRPAATLKPRDIFGQLVAGYTEALIGFQDAGPEELRDVIQFVRGKPL